MRRGGEGAICRRHRVITKGRIVDDIQYRPMLTIMLLWSMLRGENLVSC
jgi:hypothetical protein